MADLSHRHEIRMAALRKQLQQFGNIPRWQFIASFLFTVFSVIGVFFWVQGQWVKGQMAVTMD